MSDSDDPVGVVDGIADNILHLCGNLERRMANGEQMDNDEVTAVVGRLKGYAADLRDATSQIRSD